MNLTIRGYSTALFSTWYFVEELGLLFDAGDGVSAQLLQKSRKIKHVFISHADRDHLTGLLQFMQLNGRGDAPIVYYPADSGSFPALEKFSQSFDPEIKRPAWQPLRDGDEIRISNDTVIRAIRNGHVPRAETRAKSLSYLVQRVKKKLRPEFAALSGKEIAALRQQQSDETIMVEVRENLLGYSGDTPVEDLQRWRDVKTLIHEATFLSHDEMDTDPESRRNKHSVLGEVLDLATASNVEQLILGHFSSRYDAETIHETVRVQAAARGLAIPIVCILPGETRQINVRKEELIT